jgi:cobalt transporter subunit CbtA
MITRVLFAAILAGIAAGLVMSVIQHIRVTPLIIAAEAFETAEPASATAHSHSNAEAHDHGDGWAPADGLERTAFTVAANVVTGAAFGLVLAGAALLTGIAISPANGAFWGLMGFLAFTLAPSAGLPPELPGMPAADLMARQLWWWGTVAATGIGIAMLALLAQPALKALAIAIIAAPHLIGAPHLHDGHSNVPATLANAFAANAIATSAIFWIVLGVILGYMLSRTTTPDEVSP